MSPCRRSERKDYKPVRPNRLHPLRVGCRVAVVRWPPLVLPYVEGRGVIVEPALGAHLYRVRFDGDRRTRVRLVRSEYQRDPEGLVEALAHLSRSEHLLAFGADDFFDEAS